MPVTVIPGSDTFIDLRPEGIGMGEDYQRWWGESIWYDFSGEAESGVSQCI